MRLLVVSHKEVWRDPVSPTVFATVGGFPMQIGALTELFDHTTLLVFERQSPAPPGLTPLKGPQLAIETLLEPRVSGFRRKLMLILRAPQILFRLWFATGRADGVHALVPGDLGFLGLLVALARRKPLLVRHCGTWGHRVTLADRCLTWLLPRIAKGDRWILATGGGESAPIEQGNSSWIFSTSLSQVAMESLEPANAWNPREPLHLISVARLTRGKNAAAILEALPAIRQHVDANLTLVGDGPERSALEGFADSLDLGNHVRFLGNLPHAEVLRQLSGSHLFVFPTRVAEGFPKAVLEALACGVPVIASPVSVLPSLIQPGTPGACGWTLEDTDAQAVAQTALAALRNPEKLPSLSTAARQRAQKFTIEAWQDEIQSILARAWAKPLKSANQHEQPS